MDNHAYAYCPNPYCSGRSGQSQLPHAARTESGDTGSCPHCGGPMRTSCPRCGDRMTIRPQLFCPACGTDLMAATAAVPCRVCGSPATVRAGAREELAVCSERCLVTLIKSTTEVCDHCGTRFITRERHAGEEPATAEEPSGDFCSDTCRERHIAEVRGHDTHRQHIGE